MKNDNFVMLERFHIKELSSFVTSNKQAGEILFFIMERMGKYNSLVCPTSIFMDYFGISKSTAMRAIRKLKEAGFISIYKTGVTNVYCINQSVAWTSGAEDRQYCKFDGSIIISKRDNKDVLAEQKLRKLNKGMRAYNEKQKKGVRE